MAFEALVSSLTPAALGHRVGYSNTQGTLYTSTLADILSHVFNHGTHHRGQIALLVRDAGQTPLPLDLIAYLRLKG